MRMSCFSLVHNVNSVSSRRDLALPTFGVDHLCPSVGLCSKDHLLRHASLNLQLPKNCNALVHCIFDFAHWKQRSLDVSNMFSGVASWHCFPPTSTQAKRHVAK